MKYYSAMLPTILKRFLFTPIIDLVRSQGNNLFRNQLIINVPIAPLPTPIRPVERIKSINAVFTCKVSTILVSVDLLICDFIECQ